MLRLVPLSLLRKCSVLGSSSGCVHHDFFFWEWSVVWLGFQKWVGVWVGENCQSAPRYDSAFDGWWVCN